MSNRHSLHFALMLAASAILTGCATYPGDAPIVENGPPAASGTAVAIGEPVAAGELVLTPMAMIEDSRCQQGTQCVWAGRVVVKTRIDGAGWRETVDLVAGQDQMVRGMLVVLYEVSPVRGRDAGIPETNYRFKFDAKDMKPVM